MKTLELTETISIQNIVEDVSFALNKYGKHLKRHNGRKKLIKRLNRLESFRVLIDSYEYYRDSLNDELKINQGNISSNLMMLWNYIIIYAENQYRNQSQIQSQEEEEKMDNIGDEAEKILEENETESFFSENIGKLASFFESLKSNLTYFNNLLKLLGTLSSWVRNTFVYQKTLDTTQWLYSALEHKLLTLYRVLKIDKINTWFNQCREKHKWLDRIVRFSFTLCLILFGLWAISHGLHLLKTPYKFIMKMIRGHADFFDEDTFF